MPYDPGLLRFVKLSGSALLDWSFRLDESLLDSADDVEIPIEVSTLNIGDGYGIGENGELSLDPSTATAAMSMWVTGAAGPPALLIGEGDRVSITYDQVIVFQGVVTEVGANLNATPAAMPHAADYAMQLTLTMASVEAIASGQVVSWDALPAEPAIDRLRRWFTVTTQYVKSSHMANLRVPVPAEAQPGSMSMLDAARAFTAATLLPLRVRQDTALTGGWNVLEVVDTSTNWDDAPITVSADVLLDGATWLTEIGYVTSEFAKGAVRTNLIPNPDFEQSTSGWFAGTNTTLAQASGLAAHGTHSLTLRASAGGEISAYTDPNPSGTARVYPGLPYTASAYLRGASLTRPARVEIRWRDLYGVTLSTTLGVVVSETPDGWVRAVVSVAAAPANAAYASVIVRIGIASPPLLGEVHHVDAVMLEQASGPSPFFVGSAAASLIPGSAKVQANDMRLVGGSTFVDIPSDLLDSTFYLDVSLLGEATQMGYGFIAPGVIDAIGVAVPVARVNHVFGRSYLATLELAPVLNLTAKGP